MKYFVTFIFLFLLHQNKIDAQRIFKYYDKNFQYELIRDALPNSESKKQKDSLIKEIVITRLKDNKVIQTIIPSKQILSSSYRRTFFYIEDMNFDGYSDLRGFCSACYNGDIRNTYLYWLYNPNKEIFEESNELTEISNPYFDKKNQKILSSWGGGAKYFGQAIYKYRDGKFLLFEQRVDSVYGQKQDSVMVVTRVRVGEEIISKKQTYSVSNYLRLENHVLSIKY
jgi:hypothetical protein